MTREDYLEQVKDLSREERIKRLEEFYSKYAEEQDYNHLEIVCEILANDYNIFGYGTALPEIYYNNGDYSKAIAHAIDFIEKQRQKEGDIVLAVFDEVFFCMGKSYEQIGEQEKAIEAYMHVCTSIRTKANAWANGELSEEFANNIVICLNKIGKIYYDLGSYEKAFKNFDEAWQCRPSAYSALYLGVLFSQGLGTDKDVDIAERFLKTMVVNDEIEKSDKLIACYYLGKIYATEKGFINKAKAKEYLQKAKEMGYDISDVEIDQILNSVPVEKKKSLFGFFGKNKKG